jgi:hypothetical protein
LKNSNKFIQLIAVALLALVLGTPRHACGETIQKGDWGPNERVSLTLDSAPRTAAIHALADAAGWSVVVQGLDDSPVSLDVHDEPANHVLRLLLPEGEFVLEREGQLVSVRPRGGSVYPTKTAVSEPKRPGEDLFVADEGRVAKDQVVRDLFVVGSVVVEGTVTGSVAGFGGKVRLVRGARVAEDVVAFGGSVEIEDGVEIGGEVAALFGTLRRGDRPSEECVACVDPEKTEETRLLEDFFESLTRGIVLWLLGALFLALGAPRLEMLRREVEERPLKTMGKGIMTLICGLLLVVTLVFTLVGIPLAVVTAVVAAAATYIAFPAVPLAVGRRLLGERSPNPYVQLALGSFIYFLLLCVPVVGELAGTLGCLLTLGALFSTRGAGLFRRSGGAQETVS